MAENVPFTLNLVGLMCLFPGVRGQQAEDQTHPNCSKRSDGSEQRFRARCHFFSVVNSDACDEAFLSSISLCVCVCGGGLMNKQAAAFWVLFTSIHWWLGEAPLMNESSEGPNGLWEHGDRWMKQKVKGQISLSCWTVLDNIDWKSIGGGWTGYGY